MKKYILPLLLLPSLLLSACQPTLSTTPTTPPNTASPTSEPKATDTHTPTVDASPTPNPTLNATLEEIEGSVEAKDLSEADFSSAENGRTIQEAGQVRTLDDGYTRVDLSTGTLIRMAPSSYFTLVENQPEDDSLFTRIKLEIGQIWVVLNGGSLEVETPSGQASVRGSYMMIQIDPETQAALVTCLEGNCSLKNPAGIVELVNGQRAKFEPPTEGEFRLPVIGEMSERDFAEWLFFAPESENIFPLLDKEGILPWEEWQDFIPEDDENWFDLEERLPDDPLLDGNLLPLGEDGLPVDGDGSNLPGDGSNLPGDGSNLPGDGSNLPGDGSNLPGDGSNLPGDGSNLPGDGSNLPGDGSNLPGDGIDLRP